MKKEFTERAADISQRLRNSLNCDNFWDEDLEVALSTVEFSDEQMRVIKDNATQTAFSDILQNSFSEHLTHAFRDPVAKSAFILEAIGMKKVEIDDLSSLEALAQARYALQDIMHNYPLLLGEEMPQSVEGILNGYRDDLLPDIESMIADISEVTGLDPSEIKPAKGWEHINHLPPELF